MSNQKLWNSGQNSYSSGLCIATNRDGTNCNQKHAYKYLPYCKDCMKNGDPSLAVVPHPRFGKMLVCTRDLPKNYRIGLWGDVEETNEVKDEDDEWAFETPDGTSINPCRYPTSILQFSQCIGPHERVSLTFAPTYVYLENKKRGQPRQEKYGTMMFTTTEPIKKNQQLNMLYAGGRKESDAFFAERGLTRCDVWTPQYPTLLRKGVKISDLMTVPPAAKSDRERLTVINVSKQDQKEFIKNFTADGKALKAGGQLQKPSKKGPKINPKPKKSAPIKGGPKLQGSSKNRRDRSGKKQLRKSSRSPGDRVKVKAGSNKFRSKKNSKSAIRKELVTVKKSGLKARVR